MTQKFPVKVVTPGTSLGEFEPDDFVGVDDGGTGAVDAPTALTNLGAAAAADLTAHENDTGNPHSVTAAQAGAEPANANIQAHISDTANPHSVTAAQTGAEPANANIQAHIGDTANPHSVTAAQAGAEPANPNIQSHIGDTANPHGVTVVQTGGIAATEKGVANGIATLDGTTHVPIAQIPAAALSKVYPVADAAARIALTPLYEGDEAIQADDDSQWVWDGSVWIQRASTHTPMVLQISGNSKETAYAIMAQSIWPGSDSVGVPPSISVNAYCDDAADLCAIKIFDATNALTIAEITGITAVDLDSIIDMGVLANVSAGEAVWEWQGLQTDDAKNSRIDIESVVIYL